jgi:hypothetical protein
MLLQCFYNFFPRKKLCINFDKNGLGNTLGVFSQSHLVTLLSTFSYLNYAGAFLSSRFLFIFGVADADAFRRLCREIFFSPDSTDYI